MIFSAILRYTKNKITSYLGHARVASEFFNSAIKIIVDFMWSVFVLSVPTIYDHKTSGHSCGLDRKFTATNIIYY
jgi:hypothetical protein